MQRDISVYIKGSGTGETDEGDSAVTMADGICRKAAGKTHILFRETAGEDAASSSHLVLTAHSAELIRRGEVSCHFVFREGETTETVYRTMYGETGLEVRTEKLLVSETETEIHLELLYELLSGGIKIAERSMEMHFKDRETGKP